MFDVQQYIDFTAPFKGKIIKKKKKKKKALFYNSIQ
jgi:hypothetical protein